MSVSEHYNMPIIRPNTVSHDPSRDRELSMFARDKQKATKKSIILEAFVLIFSIAYTVIHFTLVHGKFLLYSLYITGIIFLIATVLWFCFEIQKNSFVAVLKSFKGCIITLSVVIYVICDILKLSSTSSSENTVEIIINDFVWFAFLFMLISSDCIPSITTPTRFIAPLLFILNAIKALLLSSNDTDMVLVKGKSGGITVNQIQEMAAIQMILFSAMFMLAFMDIKHQYFILLHNKVKIKSILPLRDYAKDDTFIGETFSIKTSWIFICMTVCVILSVCTTVWNNIDESNVSLLCGVIWNGIASVLILIMFVLLGMNHFDKLIIKHLLPQFRNNLLLASIIIIFYCEIQVMIWNKSGVLFGIDDILAVFLYCIYVILLISSDIMKISYPVYFMILLILVIMATAVWNLYMLSFGEWYVGVAQWFLILKKQAYLQIIILCVLMLWNRIIVDRENKCFVLITDRKECKDLFIDEKLKNEYPNNLVMDNDDIYSRKL